MGFVFVGGVGVCGGCVMGWGGYICVYGCVVEVC